VNPASRRALRWFFVFVSGLLLLATLVWGIAHQFAVDWPEPLPDVQTDPSSSSVLLPSEPDPFSVFYPPFLTALRSADLKPWMVDLEQGSRVAYAGRSSTEILDPIADLRSDFQMLMGPRRPLGRMAKGLVLSERDPDGIYLASLLPFVRISCAAAEAAAQEGNWNRVQWLYVDALHYSLALGQGGDLMHAAYADAGISLTLRCIRELLEIHQIPLASAAFLQTVVQEIEPALEPLAEAYRRDLGTCLDAVKTLFEAGSSSGGFSFSPLALRYASWQGSSVDQTSNHLRSLYQVSIAEAEAPYRFGKSRIATFASMGRAPGCFVDDPVGRQAAILYLPIDDSAIRQRLRLKVQCRVTAWALGFEETGKPGMLPIDPFDPEGRPLRFQALHQTGWRIWSIGEDQTDDGGHFPWAVNSKQHLDMCYQSNDLARRRVYYATD